MAAAFLPWEKWLARLLHPIYVAIRKWLYEGQRRRELDESRAWPEAEGTVVAIKWDSSLPREEVLFNYHTDLGYFAGSHWRWFEKSEAREVKAGDRLLLRYSAGDPGRSVFVRFQ